MANRISGLIYLKIDGDQKKAKGSFGYGGFGLNRESVMGSSGFDGFKETPVPAFIEGEITDDPGLDLKALAALTDSTVTLELANGKTIVLRNAFITNGDGLVGNSEEANIPIRFEGEGINEIT